VWLDELVSNVGVQFVSPHAEISTYCDCYDSLVLAGAGKSTLMTALLRIVEIDEGQILIDGQDIREVGLAKLRSNIACIPQDPTLYSGKSMNALVVFLPPLFID
jgi:ABC-type proline/glycine betaine transport system ATPase subunit